MDILADIRARLADPSLPVTREWVDQAAERYPYFTLPGVLYLRQHGIEGNDELLARLAIASPSRASLAMSLGMDAERFAQFYPAEHSAATTDTDSTIDRFLDSFGSSNPREIEALSAAIFNPTPDYADILAAQEREDQAPEQQEQPASGQDRLIADFIAQSRQRGAAIEPTPQAHVGQAEAAEVATAPISQAAAPDEGMLSESLAKMYITRRNYAKALGILQSLNEQYPEKSIYFADQIRFLRKLVLNQRAEAAK